MRLLNVQTGEVLATTTVTVGAGLADVPVLDWRGYAILAVTLMVVALLRLRG